MLHRILQSVRSHLLKGRLEREMREEMSVHIEQATARLRARGKSAEEALREARREFGNELRLQEEGRSARGTMWLDALIADSRFALRQFVRRPVITLTMMVVLSAGMAISTLLFSFVHSYLVQPPRGVALSDDLVRIRGSRTLGVDGRSMRLLTEDEVVEYRKLSGSFASVAAWTDALVAVSVPGDAQRGGQQARATFVTSNYSAVLDLRPPLGAGLPVIESEASLGAVGVLSYSTWDKLFARDPAALGSTVLVNGLPVTVVGVGPEHFSGVSGADGLQVWLPLSAWTLVMRQAAEGFWAVGRLREGTTHEEASSAVRVVAARMASTSPQLAALDPSADVAQLLATNADPEFEQEANTAKATIGLLALMVLLVTSTNVSGLLTGLATARRQEISIRMSLGAARVRIIRQLLTESAILATVSAGVALALVAAVLRIVTQMVPGLPFEVGITWPATLFTFSIGLGAGLLFGLSPALHALRLALAGAMRGSNATIVATRARLQRALVVAQIALTQPLMVLLAAALLIVINELQPRRSLAVADRIVSILLRVPAPNAGSWEATGETQKLLRETTRRLQLQLASLPGVERATITWYGQAPLGAYLVHPEDKAGGTTSNAVRLTGQVTGAGYFDVLEIPVVRGREFDVRDYPSAESDRSEVPIVLGAEEARMLWPGSDALGRRLQAANDSILPRTLVVVGIVDDRAAAARTAPGQYRVYVPPDTTRAYPGLQLRTLEAADPLLPEIHRIVRPLTPGMITGIGTMANLDAQQTRWYRLAVAGVSAAGAGALILSALGLYAVVAFSVVQRAREIAVRVAVGARHQQIVRRFVLDGLGLGLLGMLIGLPISPLGLRILQSVTGLPHVGALPLMTFAGTGVLLVATLAAWIPARQAATVDPASVLRGEG